MSKPVRFTCNVPGLFKALDNDGYGMLLLPLIGHLDRIAKRAMEIEDLVILEELQDMNVINLVVQENDH